MSGPVKEQHEKHLATIIGIVLTLAVAVGAFFWDGSSRAESSYRRARALHSACYAERQAATGAPVSATFPECTRYFDEDRDGHSARVTSAAITGAGAGGGFALLFFGGLWLSRRRRGTAPADDSL